MRGHVTKRGKASWVFVIDAPQQAPTAKRRREWHSGYRTRKEAEAALATYLVSREAGTWVEPSKLTVGEFLERWLVDHMRARVRPSTYHSYTNQVRRHLIPALGAHRLTKLLPLHIEAHYAAALERGLSARSVTYQHRLLREALQQAVRWQLLGRNVADAVTPPTAHRKEMRALDAEQVRTLLRAAEKDPHYALLYTAIYTGLRRSELLGLRWDDVDLDAAMASIRQTIQRLPGEGWVHGAPKTAKGRRQVALPGSVVTVLRTHHTAQLAERLRLGPIWQNSGLVFTNATGCPVDPSGLSRRFARFLKAAALPPIRFHDLRHTHASLMLRQGVHPKIVSERLGHATVGITLDTYSHVLPGLQAEAARKLDEWLSGPREDSETAL